jgi:hypothetical protein
MTGAGKVQVVVRSRRVPARVVDLSLPRASYAGIPVIAEKRRTIVYEDRLDQEHLRAIDDGRKLAGELGLALEVIDESRSSFFGRVLTSLGRRSSYSPKLVILPSYISTCGVGVSSKAMAPC